MFNSPEFDALVDEADSSSDQALREELYKQAEMLLIEDATAISPIYYYTYVRLYKPWLTNVVISPVTGDPSTCGRWMRKPRTPLAATSST